MENAPSEGDHPEPKQSPAEEGGVPDEATRGPEGPELHDQVGHETPPGTPAGDTGGPVDSVGAPPAVPASAQPATGDLSGRPEPAGAFGPTRTDIPPHAERPDAARGWDSAVDLEKEPGVVPDPAAV